MRTPTILHVEDDPSDLLLFRTALERADIHAHVVQVSNVEDARERLKNLSRTDLIVVDLKMPRSDGFELLEWVRAQSKFRSTPVYVLSSSDAPEDIDRATRLGATRYFLKATLFMTIVEELKQTLQTSSPSLR